MATTTQASLLEEARGLLDDVVTLRRRIHRHPEIGLTLPRTQRAVRWRPSTAWGWRCGRVRRRRR